MNLDGLVEWGRKTLALVDDPSRLERERRLTAERVRAKLGWLEEFREALAEWSAWHGVIEEALDFVRCRGLYAGAGRGVGGGVAGGVGRYRRRVARAVDRVRHGRVVEGPDQASACPGRRRCWSRASGSSRRWRTGSPRAVSRGWCSAWGRWSRHGPHETIGEALERCRVRDVWTGAERSWGVGAITAKTGLQPAKMRNKLWMNEKSAQDGVFTRPAYSLICLIEIQTGSVCPPRSQNSFYGHPGHSNQML